MADDIDDNIEMKLGYVNQLTWPLLHSFVYHFPTCQLQ